jgi:hypothetical protein
MSQISKSNGSPTVYSLRRAFGIKGHRSSGFNACIGNSLKGKKYNMPPGEGGRNNMSIRRDFTSAVQSCKGRGGRRIGQSFEAMRQSYS